MRPGSWYEICTCPLFGKVLGCSPPLTHFHPHWQYLLQRFLFSFHISFSWSASNWVTHAPSVSGLAWVTWFTQSPYLAFLCISLNKLYSEFYCYLSLSTSWLLSSPWFTITNEYIYNFIFNALIFNVFICLYLNIDFKY